MGTTRDHCRYIKALLTAYEGAITIWGIDRSVRPVQKANDTVIAHSGSAKSES